MFKKLLKSKRGASILIMVMVIGMILLGLAGGVTRMTTHQTVDRSRYENYKDEFAAAENGLNTAFGRIQFLVTQGTPNLTQQMASTTAPTVPGFVFPSFAVNQTFSGMEAVTSGQWTGLTLNRQRYSIDVTAKKTAGTSDRFNHPGVKLRQNIELTYIPLYLFAIFYNPLMEIAPSPVMQVNGRVHSNGSAYFQCDNTLKFLANVTVAGKAYHGRAPNSGMSVSAGDVSFLGPGNSQVTMKRSDADGWLDALDTDWMSAATTKWTGGFKDQSMGVMPLGLPIPNVSDPHVIIEPKNASDTYSMQQEKMAYKAGLTISSDASGTITGKDQAGNTVDLTYPDPANPSGPRKKIYSVTTFYDPREGKTVRTIDINAGNMIQSNIMPTNGILYVHNVDIGSNPGVVRMVNAAKLPQSNVASGFTIATDNPVYIKGDYNTTNKTLALVAGDALYVLSNAWTDANSTSGTRNASGTTVNTVCMTGIVATANNIYSGGVENYFRYLENWSGVTHTFSGSIISMWLSQKAKGVWGQSGVYSPPTRMWSWDTALGGINGPPGTPRVIQLNKQAWQMVSTTTTH